MARSSNVELAARIAIMTDEERNVLIDFINDAQMRSKVQISRIMSFVRSIKKIFVVTIVADSSTSMRDVFIISTIFSVFPSPVSLSVSRVVADSLNQFNPRPSVPFVVFVRGGLSSADFASTVFPSAKNEPARFDAPMEEPSNESDDAVEVSSIEQKHSKRRRLAASKEKEVHHTPFPHEEI